MNPTYTWMDGRLVPWQESRIHIASEAVLRGASVFEGIRAYRAADSDELNLFRVGDHLARLFGTSMRFLRMRLPYGPDQLVQALVELLRANQVREDAHLRLVAYFGPEGEGDQPAGAFALAFPRPRSRRVTEGTRVTLSPWRRISDNAMPPRVKASANYLNSLIVSADAQSKGFDSAIVLNERGRVAEGPGQNLFLVRGGVLSTPRTTDSILEGVTRATLIELAGRLGIPVQERAVDATELYVADELFFCGTAAEVQPIVEIDGYRVGEGRIGPVTERIQRSYFALVRGQAQAPEGWLTPVYGQPVAA